MCGLETCKSLRLRNDWASRYAPRMPFTVSHAAADRDEKPPAVSRRGFSINYLLDVERLDVASVSAPYISIPTIPPMPRGAPPWARSGEELKIMELRKLRRTRREFLKNAAMAAFAAPAIGQGGTRPQPARRPRLPLSSWSTAPGTGLVLAEGQRSTHCPGSSRV